MPMKKIDILNYITDFRKSPNNIRSYEDLLTSLGKQNEEQLVQLLSELKQLRVVRETEADGKKFYQVTSK